MKEEVVKILKNVLEEKELKIKKEEIFNLLEIPPNSELGDYAFPCFFLCEKFKQNPSEIAIMLRAKMGDPNPTDFQDIQTNGPYINFFINKKNLAIKTINNILKEKEKYGKSKIGKKKKVLIEFSSPNIAKPFGIGHLRSTIIGNSLANIFEFNGFNVKKINYLGDWGTQFGKLIFGYKKFGSEKKLKKNPLKHLLEIYVKTNKKIYEEKAREEFKKLESGDQENILLWKKFKEISLEELKRIYSILGIIFDSYENESEYFKKEKNKEIEELFLKLKEKKLIKKSKGALVFSLKKYKLLDALIKKSDGTTLYLTRDLFTAINRYKKYSFEKMIYEVGQEQKLHFKQLFKILELIGYDWAKKCVHVDHGLYLGENGKKLSTRKGSNISVEEIIKKTKILAEKEIKNRDKKISKKRLEERSMKIAIASIFYGDLKNNRSKDILFDLKKFVSFEGDTGPYLLYSYARAGSILKKSKNKKKNLNINELEKIEIELIKKLSSFPSLVENSMDNLNPSIIANYAHSISQLFNEFYHSCRVVGDKEEDFRILLVSAFRQVLKNSLNLLGIQVLEEM